MITDLLKAGFPCVLLQTLEPHRTEDELFDILNSPTQRIDQDKVKTFIENNSWARFIEKIHDNLK